MNNFDLICFIQINSVGRVIYFIGLHKFSNFAKFFVCKPYKTGINWIKPDRTSSGDDEFLKNVIFESLERRFLTMVWKIWFCRHGDDVTRQYGFSLGSKSSFKVLKSIQSSTNLVYSCIIMNFVSLEIWNSSNLSFFSRNGQKRDEKGDF